MYPSNCAIAALALALKAFPVALRTAAPPGLDVPEDDWSAFNLDPRDAIDLLQRGQTYVLDTDSNGVAGAGLPRGAVILGNKTLQVEYFYGELDSNYNTRAVLAIPRGL